MSGEHFAPHEILQVLDRHRVQYVLVGGYAAELHGAQRPTIDIDLTPATTAENLTRVVAALRELQAGIRVDALPEPLPFETSAAALADMTALNLRTPHGDVDLTFHPSGTEGYPDLIRDATPHQVGTVTLQLASLADIIRSKEAAGRTKDAEALPELYRLAGRTPPDPDSAAATHEPNARLTPQERIARARAQIEQFRSDRDQRNRVDEYRPHSPTERGPRY
ncbi:hypothetical protein [Allobranchiibius sp. CTAmp26]|uniref:hypothetical protein n=1 Tax=Allobranchiibius sp. CTAmp26 TaxID=2815214 RepID=UPI001AA13563|nr:hypothetical protein [Allobranchiibius sp. CTAmp26]MBO1756864.1 hypothetical protein [Allobranchiibius sp. CTAmp26]